MVASRDDIPMKGADNYGKIITILQYFLVFGVFFGKLWYYSSSLYLSQSVDIGIMVMASLVVLLGLFGCKLMGMNGIIDAALALIVGYYFSKRVYEERSKK